MPLKKFSTVRAGWQEVMVFRHGMTPPNVGDDVDHDGYVGRVTRVTVRPCEPRDVEILGADPSRGDFMVSIECEWTE